MKNVFKVKDARQTVRDVFINGLKQVGGVKDFVLTKDSIKIVGPKLEKGSQVTFTQETTITV